MEPDNTQEASASVDRESQDAELKANEKENDEVPSQFELDLGYLDDLLIDLGYSNMGDGTYRKENHDIKVQSIIHKDNLS